MENFNCIIDEDLEVINGGDAVDVALTVGGYLVKGVTGTVLGALGAVKTCSDWLDSQTW
ncbi:hypothetical protein WHY38_15530 (plasmid) [Clostridium perfringens]|uniref:hypothetical protein n=1 Tax=Clostridium perfringens TaxID=1502 RepID=UPI0030CB82AF